MSKAKLVHIVEDEVEVCRSTAFLLRIAGIDWRCWQSGSAFLSCADLDAEDCVILDLRMAGTDGFEVQRELAARHSRLKVIMVSGHADAHLAARALGAGAVGFIEKPYDQARLLALVEQALSTKGA